MYYAINCKRDGYISIDYKSKINFRNDILYFKTLNDAYKYLYYANSNVFEIKSFELNPENTRLLKIIILHGGNVSVISEINSILDLIKKLYIILLIFYMYRRLQRIDFSPTIIESDFEEKKLYILDGFVSNDDFWNYTGELVNATTNRDILPFDAKVVKKKIEIQRADQKYLYGILPEKYEYSIFNNQIKKNEFIPKVYIYSAEKTRNGMLLSIFYQGYEKYIGDFTINYNGIYRIVENEDWNYYSRNSRYFKDNFIKLKIDSCDSQLSFSYDHKKVLLYLTRDLANNTVFNDLHFKKTDYTLSIKSYLDDVVSPEYKRYMKVISESKELIYIFNDKKNYAGNNAEAIYRYYQKNTNHQIYYALKKSCSDWKRLKEQGFNLIEHGTLIHKELYLRANMIVSSTVKRNEYDPFYPSRQFVNLEHSKFIYLANDIISENHHELYYASKSKIDLTIVANEYEKQLLENYYNFKNVIIGGNARADSIELLKGDIKQNVIYAPYDNPIYVSNFKTSDYVVEISKVLASTKIKEVLDHNKLNFTVVLPTDFRKNKIKLDNPYDYQIIDQDKIEYTALVSKLKLLITDSSPLMFDAMYQNKIVIEHHPYKLYHKKIRIKSLSKNINSSNSIGELEKLINKLEKNNFCVANKFNTAVDFLSISDGDNCKKIYDLIENFLKGELWKKLMY